MPVRGYLNERSVLAIFAQRPQPGAPASSMCKVLAVKFRVSLKTIRDIWNRKSWVTVTAPFCTDADTYSSPALIESDSDRESSASPSHQDPFANFAAAIHHEAQTRDLLDDIEELRCSSD
eukprot:2417165-Rhodomonas_salina.1